MGKYRKRKYENSSTESDVSSVERSKQKQRSRRRSRSRNRKNHRNKKRHRRKHYSSESRSRSKSTHRSRHKRREKRSRPNRRRSRSRSDKRSRQRSNQRSQRRRNRDHPRQQRRNSKERFNNQKPKQPQQKTKNQLERQKQMQKREKEKQMIRKAKMRALLDNSSSDECDEQDEQQDIQVNAQVNIKVEAPKQEESKIKEETTTKTNHIEIELPPLKRLNSSEKLIQDEHTKKFEEIFSKEQKNESLDNSMMDFTVKRKQSLDKSFNNNLQVEQKEEPESESDGIDPLDAFMTGISKDEPKQEEVYRNEEGAIEFKEPPIQWIEPKVNQDQLITFDQIFGLTEKIGPKPQQLDEEEDEEMKFEIPKSKMKIQLPIFNFKEDKEEPVNKMEEEVEEEDTQNDSEEDKFHQKFIEAFRKRQALEEKERKEKEFEEQKREKALREREICEEDIPSVLLNKKAKQKEDYFAKQKRLALKKQIRAVDHKSITYDFFRKNLYIATQEVASLTQEQVENLRFKLDKIKVRPKNCPAPITSWYQCGLSNKLIHTLMHKKRFLEPFPIQAQALPAIMSGRDIIGIAETGSGKTLAFILPMIRQIKAQRKLKEGDGPIALILAPTRELAYQIFLETRSFAKPCGLTTVCVYGGSGIAGQLSELKRGAEIVVCTPGRMIDVLTTSSGKITNLRRVTYVVIDEADRMFDLGFEPQISKIFQNIRPDKQTVMFSATFPKSVESLARSILLKPVEVVVGKRGQACKNVEQFVEIREETSKYLRLLQLFGDWEDKGQILVFVDRQEDADALFKKLYDSQYKPCLLHGGQDSHDRQYTLQDFKKGIKNIMVATSVIARGLDVPNIVLVINFSCPNHMEDYVHRIGRTGRAGNKGTAITFITPAEQDMAPEIIKAMRNSGVEPPEELLALNADFRQKVAMGEKKVQKNKFMLAGQGFTFNEDEFAKIKKSGMQVMQDYGDQYGFEDAVSDEEIIQRSKRANEQEKKKPQQLAFDLIKNPETKKAVFQEAFKAAKDALEAGATEEQWIIAAQNAVKQVLLKFKKVHSVAQGIKGAMRAIQHVEAQAMEEGDYITIYLEINDYPHGARIKVTNKELLEEVARLTSCNISVRGIYIEKGKKAKLTQRKQYIHIQGENKNNVMNAYRELFKVLEDEAEMARLQGRARAPGKYSF